MTSWTSRPLRVLFLSSLECCVLYRTYSSFRWNIQSGCLLGVKVPWVQVATSPATIHFIHQIQGRWLQSSVAHSKWWWIWRMLKMFPCASQHLYFIVNEAGRRWHQSLLCIQQMKNQKGSFCQPMVETLQNYDAPLVYVGTITEFFMVWFAFLQY